jgi:hypothetical protein
VNTLKFDCPARNATRQIQGKLIIGKVSGFHNSLSMFRVLIIHLCLFTAHTQKKFPKATSSSESEVDSDSGSDSDYDEDDSSSDFLEDSE